MSEPVAYLPVAWMDKSGTPRSLTALMEDNFAGGLYSADAIERKDAAIAELVDICTEFVRRVECGEIRSKRTYEQMKAVIAKYDIPKAES